MRTHGGCLKARNWYLLSLAVIVLDHVTKFLATWKLEYGVLVPLLPVLDLTLLHNRGAAFSFLSDASGWQRYLFVVLALSVSVALVFFLRRPGHAQLHLGLALILGGAIGNVIDRIHIGQVVDFLLVYHGAWSWPAFNVADSAITIGAGLLILDSFQHRRGDEPQAS